MASAASAKLPGMVHAPVSSCSSSTATVDSPNGGSISNSADSAAAVNADDVEGGCTHHEGRGTIFYLGADATASTTAAITPAPRRTRAAQAAPAAAAEQGAAEPTAAEEVARAQKMFVIDAPGPIASKPRISYRKATKKLVQLISKVVADWKKPHVEALSRSFGNFDRVVAQGWLLADALGMSLLSREQAFVLGGSVRHQATKLEADLKAKRKAAGKRIAQAVDEAARAALAAAAEAEVEELLREEAELNLSNLPEPRTIGGTKRKRVETLLDEQATAAPAVARPTIADLRRAAHEADVELGLADDHKDSCDLRLREAKIEVRVISVSCRPSNLYKDSTEWLESLGEWHDLNEREPIGDAWSPSAWQAWQDEVWAAWCNADEPWDQAELAVEAAIAEVERAADAVSVALERSVNADELLARARQAEADARWENLERDNMRLRVENERLQYQIMQLRAERSGACVDAEMGCMW